MFWDLGVGFWVLGFGCWVFLASFGFRLGVLIDPRKKAAGVCKLSPTLADLHVSCRTDYPKESRRVSSLEAVARGYEALNFKP